jgi:RNA polymerase sigma-70 factor (ECF subfamily)
MAFVASRTRSRQRSVLRIRANRRITDPGENARRDGGLGLSLVAVNQPLQSAAMFEELAVPLFDSLFNFAHWLTHNREEAEDLVQETYAKALKGFSSFRPGTNFRAWIFRILRNTFLTSRTGLQMKMTVPLEPEEEEAVTTLAVTHETPESLLLQQATGEVVQAALEQLTLEHREIILLCDVEEMKYEEIAQTLDIPIGTVMSRVARARKALRLRLSDSGTVHSGKSAQRSL